VNRQLITSLTAFFLSLCSLLLLLFLFAFFFTLVIESPPVSQVHVFSDPTTQMAPQVSLSPLPFAVSGITLSTEIELEPVFIAPNWREPLPTASKTPTIMLIATATPTTEATSTIALSDFSLANRESEITPTPTVVATITPLPKPTLTHAVSDLSPTVASTFADATLTVSVTSLPEQTASPTHSPAQPTILPSATATLAAPSPSEVPTVAPSPSEVPTVAPSPSEVPTVAPSPSEVPTVAPSPSEVPTVAPSPSEVPTIPPATLLPSSEALPNVPSISELTYQVMFQHIGAQYDLDWRLLASVAYRESSLNASAVGKDGEQGLMQILPSTWDEFAPRVGVSDPFDPVSNVQVGTAYLAYLRDQLVRKGYPEEYWALVAYNWGPNNLARLLQEDGNWGGIPMIRQDYAYQIIEQITESNNEWLQKKLQERVY